MFKLIYSKEEIDRYYDYVVTLAQKAFYANNIKKSISNIELAANLQYYYNSIYTDMRLEELILSISRKLLPVSLISGRKKRYLFYDSLGADRQGLTQQYIEALNDLHSEYLFVFENESDARGIKRDEILSMLQDKSDVRILELWKFGNYENQINILYNAIMEYSPSTIFMHLCPQSCVPLVVFSAFPNIIKYQINLTDHAFWLGSKVLDYSLEFRNYGYTVSVEKRYIKQSKVLLFPYYPVVQEEFFEGFPLQAKDKIVIFSGGSYYKIYDKSNTYFELLKNMLLENDNAIVLFAGFGNEKPFLNFIHENHFEDRIVLSGYRKDINEIFKNCDIYMNTFPLSGGLMSQYAAIHSKPILALSDGKRAVEDIVCTRKYGKISCYSKDEFLEEAQHLISDVNYRREKGDFMRELIMGKEQFKENLNNLLNNRYLGREPKIIPVDYESFFNTYYYRLNNTEYAVEAVMCKSLKWKIGLVFPKVLVNTLCILPHLLMGKLRKKKGIMRTYWH